MADKKFSDQSLDYITFKEPKKRVKKWVEKGGPGSGNFGHEGRPGEVGGSTGGGEAAPKPTSGEGGGGEGESSGGGLSVISSSFIKKDYSSLKSEVSWRGSRGEIAKGALYNVAKAGSHGFIISDGKEHVGIVSLIGKSGSTYVEMLATKRGGYGRQMMIGVAKEAASKGRGITLNAVPNAIGFYEKLGMKKIGETDEHGQQQFSLSKTTTKQMSRFVLKSKDDEPKDGVFVASPEYWDDVKKGGPGSGNFGHEGRPGEVGGSEPGGGGEGSQQGGESGGEGGGGVVSHIGTQTSAQAKELKKEVKDWKGDRGLVAGFAIDNLREPGTRGLIMREGGTLVGIGSYEIVEEGAEPSKGSVPVPTKTLYVDDMATGKSGYGSLMMREIAKVALKEKVGAMDFVSLKEARGFYKNLGITLRDDHAHLTYSSIKQLAEGGRIGKK